MEYDLNGAWMATIAESFVQEPPRFLLEVWMTDKNDGRHFCGELLLPRVHDLKSTMQNRKLFKLNRSSKVCDHLPISFHYIAVFRLDSLRCS